METESNNKEEVAEEIKRQQSQTSTESAEEQIKGSDADEDQGGAPSLTDEEE